MSALTIPTRICIALLTPFWWGLALMVLAGLGSVSPWWRVRMQRLFDWLERTHGEPAPPEQVAARKEASHVAAA